MKIVITTPLFPPDIEPVAQYGKELAGRLAQGKQHQVTVATYGKFPELIPQVSFITTDKKMPLFVRLPLYTLRLLKAALTADVLYVQNGASVELPALLVVSILRTPLVFFLTDKNAEKQTEKKLLQKKVTQALCKRSRAIITELPKGKPEILSLCPHPEQEFVVYETSWTKHLQELSTIPL